VIDSSTAPSTQFGVRLSRARWGNTLLSCVSRYPSHFKTLRFCAPHELRVHKTILSLGVSTFRLIRPICESTDSKLNLANIMHSTVARHVSTLTTTNAQGRKTERAACAANGQAMIQEATRSDKSAISCSEQYFEVNDTSRRITRNRLEVQLSKEHTSVLRGFPHICMYVWDMMTSIGADHCQFGRAL
jgi:hypothetical protein